jgi:hypothetical protein
MRPPMDPKDIDLLMISSYHPRPLHRVLPTRSMLLLAMFVLVVTALAAAAAQM